MGKRIKIFIIFVAVLILVGGGIFIGNLFGLFIEAPQKQVVKLYPANVMKDGKEVWGLINQKGDIVVEPAYDTIEDYNEFGFTKVSKNKKFGMLDKDGKEVLKVEYNEITPVDPVSGYTVTKKGNVDSVYNFKMVKVFQNEGYRFKGYLNGITAISSYDNRIQNPKIGYMDKTFKIILPSKYKLGDDFIKDKAYVTNSDGKYSIIDLKGNVLMNSDYELAFNGNDTIGYKDASNNKIGLIKITGEKVTEPIYYELTGSEEDRFIVSTEKNKAGIIDSSGKFIVPPEYYEIKIIGDGLYLAYQNTNLYNDNNYTAKLRKGAILNRSGEKLTDFIIREVGKCKEGIYWVAEDNKTYFCDKNAKKIDALPEVEGNCGIKYLDNGELIRVFTSERLYYVNKKGEVIWDSIKKISLGDKGEIFSKILKIEPLITILYPYVEMKNTEQQRMLNEYFNKVFVKEVEINQTGSKLLKRTYSYVLNGKVMSIIINDSTLNLLDSNKIDTTKKAININIDTGKVYLFEDLFKKDSNYIKTVSGICNITIDENNKKEEKPKMKRPEFNANQKFKIDKDGVTLIFDPQEILEKPIGEAPSITINFIDMADKINKDGELWKALGF